MPVEISTISDGSIALAHCFGNLTKADIHQSLDFAFGTHRIEPGGDRIVTIDPDAQLHALDTDTLKSIQQRVFEEETRGGRAAQFRSVLVHASPPQERIMLLYQAIWSGLNLPGVEFFVVADMDEALDILSGTERGDTASRRA